MILADVILKSVLVIIALAQILVGYIAYLLRQVRADVKIVAAEMRTLNGRLIRQEQWSRDHELSDKDRFDQLNDGQHRIQERIDAVRTRQG